MGQTKSQYIFSNYIKKKQSHRKLIENEGKWVVAPWRAG